jgi:uncharacterized protein with HEPN domain
MRIRDILESIRKIQECAKGATLESLQADWKTVDAIVRNLTIIGEAARHVPADVRERYPAVPWDDMRDMRNVVVHEYFRVSYPILWRTIQANLPPLARQLESLLETEGGRAGDSQGA